MLHSKVYLLDMADGTAGLGILDANHWRRPSSASWHRAAPREYPSIGLLCEADLTKPDIIETAAGDPEETFNGTLIDHEGGNVEDAQRIVTAGAPRVSLAARTDWRP